MNKSWPDSQRGLGFFGFIQGALILVLVSLAGMKLIPLYIQDAGIKKLLVAITSDPDMQKASVHDIRASFNKRASIDSITVIKGEDIEMDTSTGKLILSSSYAVKVPLAGNVSLCLDFNPSSASK
jgi:hypothetical protein